MDPWVNPSDPSFNGSAMDLPFITWMLMRTRVWYWGNLTLVFLYTLQLESINYTVSMSLEHEKAII